MLLPSSPLPFLSVAHVFIVPVLFASPQPLLFFFLPHHCVEVSRISCISPSSPNQRSICLCCCWWPPDNRMRVWNRTGKNPDGWCQSPECPTLEPSLPKELQKWEVTNLVQAHVNQVSPTRRWRHPNKYARFCTTEEVPTLTLLWW